MQHIWLGIPGPVRSVIVVILVLLLGLWFSLRFGNYWAPIFFPKQKSRKLPSLLARWRRPSTILLVLLIGYTIYTLSISRWTEMAVVVLFVLRYWENDAYVNVTDDVKDSDVDDAHEKVLAADSRPKEKHWYDDD